jgi:hypothetical protein
MRASNLAQWLCKVRHRDSYYGTCVIEIQCDSVVNLLNAYSLYRSYADKPSVELITPVARFDKKIVLTKFNFSYSSSLDNIESICMQTICLDCTNR